MVLDKTEARTLLETHISSKASKKTTTSDSSNDSDDTNVAGCSSKKVRTPVKKTLTNLTSTGVKHVVYCKAKILVKKSDTPTKTMVKTFGAFFTTLLKIDKQLKVFKYKDKTNTSYLSRPDQIPETPSQVKAFFHGSYRPKSDSYQIWPELKIGLSMDIENFIGDAKCLLEDKKLGALYKKDLQAEETEDIGFFLFSNRFQDTKRLANSIKLEIGRQFKFVPDLNLRWRKLYDPMKKKQDKNLNKDDVKAIFIEVIKGQDEKIARAIMKLYSKSNKTHIDGEKMRFIPRPKYSQNSGLHQRYSDLINRQDWYSQGIERATSFEISNLDSKASELPFSMRIMVMQMLTKDGNPMFTSVDLSWDGGVVFTFPKVYEDESRNRIADMASYLHFLHGDLILCKYFSPDAAQRAISSPWNDTEKRAISALDQDFDDILRDCEEIDWLKQPVDKKVVDFTAPQGTTQNQPLFNHLPNDDKSLETFGGTSNSKSSTQSGQKRQKIPNTGDNDKQKRFRTNNMISTNIDDEDLTDDDDAQTIDTLSSRMSNLETNMSQILGLLQQSISSKTPGRPPCTNATPITPNSKERGEGSV